jgi:serine/threonine-protein kinase
LGDFRILSLLGEGGSGVVYAARWGHREVALKVLRSDLVPSDSARKRFLSEARILAEIDHASVVKVYNVGELPDGRPYLAMEKLDGESLSDRLQRGALPIERALEYFDQIAGAVTAFHERGLIHRDLKPENVYLVSGGAYAVLLDFGIAKDLDGAAETITQEGLVKGTPAYMAPERFFGAAATVSSDIYELAVTLFAMLAGRLPWDRPEDPDARLNPKRPSQYGVSLPGAVEPELMRALSTRPESRPASAAELLRGIHESRADAATIARATVDLQSRNTPSGMAPLPSGQTTAVQPSSRRSFAIAAIGIAVGIAGLVSALVVTLSRDDNPITADKLEPEPAPEPLPTPDPTPPGPTPTLVDPDRPQGPVPDRVMRWHSKDTNVIVGIRWGQLTQSAVYREMVSALSIGELDAAMSIIRNECGFDPGAKLEWITLAIPGDDFQRFEMAGRGEWTQDGFLDCIVALAKWSGEEGRFEQVGDHKRFKVRDEAALLGWMDRDTFLVTNRENANRGWMDKRVLGMDGARSKKRLRELYKDVNPDATFWIIADDASWMDVSSLEGVPAPRSMHASVVLGDDMTIDVAWRYESAVQAKAAASALTKSLDEVKKDAFVKFIIGDSGIQTRGNDALIHLYTNPTSTGLIGKALGTTLNDTFKSL